MPARLTPAEVRALDSVLGAIDRMLYEERISDAELSRRLGVSRQRINQMLGRIENMPTLRTIARLADALGYDVVLTLRKR
jgi:transcriptional regulator with XRE-family HTH domain